VLSQSQHAAANIEEARRLRAEGLSYRQIGRRLQLSSAQLGLVRRSLKREKAGRTRLRATMPNATDRDLLVSRSVLPAGLRRCLIDAGYRTLGDLADRLDDADLPGIETLPGIGPHQVRLVKALLDHYELLHGTSDLQGEIERLFPELREGPAG